MKKYLRFFGLYYGYFIIISVVSLLIHDGSKGELATAVIWFDLFYILSGLLLVWFILKLLFLIESEFWKKTFIISTVLLQMNLIVFFLDGKLWLSYALASDFLSGAELQEINNLVAHVAVVAAFLLAVITMNLFKEGDSARSAE